jgi:hypothetical protein
MAEARPLIPVPGNTGSAVAAILPRRLPGGLILFLNRKTDVP